MHESIMDAQTVEEIIYQGLLLLLPRVVHLLSLGQQLVQIWDPPLIIGLNFYLLISSDGISQLDLATVPDTQARNLLNYPDVGPCCSLDTPGNQP